MTQPHPATSVGDIRTLSEDYQTVGADLVEDLYWHLVGRNGHGVTIDGAREYIGRLTARFRREILRSWLDHLAPGPVARANSAGHKAARTVDDARGSAPGRVDPPPARSDQGQRQSLAVDEVGSPSTDYLLLRAAGSGPAGLTNAELLARAVRPFAAELPATTIAARHESIPAPRRGPGRPGWTRDLFEERWREARAATPQPHTFRALAENFRALDGLVGGVSGDHLGRLRRERFPE